jgi:hypothetical protein
MLLFFVVHYLHYIEYNNKNNLYLEIKLLLNDTMVITKRLIIVYYKFITTLSCCMFCIVNDIDDGDAVSFMFGG